MCKRFLFHLRKCITQNKCTFSFEHNVESLWSPVLLNEDSAVVQFDINNVSAHLLCHVRWELRQYVEWFDEVENLN